MARVLHDVSSVVALRPFARLPSLPGGVQFPRVARLVAKSAKHRPRAGRHGLVGFSVGTA